MNFAKFVRTSFLQNISGRVLGQLPPRKIAPQIITPRIIASGMIAPRIISPRTIALEDNCPRGKFSPGQLPPMKIAPGKLLPRYKVYPLNNHPHSNKLPSKRTTSEPRKTMHCLRVLLLKNHSTKSYFSRLQLRSKKWFTSAYFLQVLTKPRRTPVIRGHLSLNVS